MARIGQLPLVAKSGPQSIASETLGTWLYIHKEMISDHNLRKLRSNLSLVLPSDENTAKLTS